MLTNSIRVFEALFLQILVQKFHTLPLTSNKSNKDFQKMIIHRTISEQRLLNVLSGASCFGI